MSGESSQMDSGVILVRNCQKWFQLKFKGGLQETLRLIYFSELETQKSLQVYLSLTLMRIKLV